MHKDYHGSVIIRGLVENTTIKITDLSGRLVYETYSNGGTGVWNVRDFDGNRVPSGVYLIFCASLDGSFSANTKNFCCRLLIVTIFTNDRINFSV